MERDKEREPVLVPVRQREMEQEIEIPREITDDNYVPAPEMPRRWLVY